MLSRVADSIYWLNRYIERAENVARFIDVNLHLMLDLPAGTRIVVVGALMALVLILRPAGLTGGREVSLWQRRPLRVLTKFAR